MAYTTTKKIAMLMLALFGVAMSGYLSYQNYFGSGCSVTGFLSCGGPKAVHIFGQPTCIYGLAMFLLSAILMLINWSRSQPKGILTAIFFVATIGVLFSGGLSFDELFIRKIAVLGLPACAYGFLFYAGIWVMALMTLHSLRRPPI